MTHGHKHSTHHDHQEHGHSHRRRGPHKDWRVVTAVVLMLGAMVIYLMTMDESEVPGEPVQPPIDAVEAE